MLTHEGDWRTGVIATTLPNPRGRAPALSPNFGTSNLHHTIRPRASDQCDIQLGDRFSPAAHCFAACCLIDETMKLLAAVCETLNRFIHFEHEQIDSANHFYRTVSITLHNPQGFDNVPISGAVVDVFLCFIPYLHVLYFVFCWFLHDCVLCQRVTNPASWLPECNKCDLIWFDMVTHLRKGIFLGRRCLHPSPKTFRDPIHTPKQCDRAARFCMVIKFSKGLIFIGAITPTDPWWDIEGQKIISPTTYDLDGCSRAICLR